MQSIKTTAKTNASSGKWKIKACKSRKRTETMCDKWFLYFKLMWQWFIDIKILQGAWLDDRMMCSVSRWAITFLSYGRYALLAWCSLRLKWDTIFSLIITNYFPSNLPFHIRWKVWINTKSRLSISSLKLHTWVTRWSYLSKAMNSPSFNPTRHHRLAPTSRRVCRSGEGWMARKEAVCVWKSLCVHLITQNCRVRRVKGI